MQINKKIKYIFVFFMFSAIAEDCSISGNGNATKFSKTKEICETFCEGEYDCKKYRDEASEKTKKILHSKIENYMINFIDDMSSINTYTNKVNMNDALKNASNCNISKMFVCPNGMNLGESDEKFFKNITNKALEKFKVNLGYKKFKFEDNKCINDNDIYNLKRMQFKKQFEELKDIIKGNKEKNISTNIDIDKVFKGLPKLGLYSFMNEVKDNLDTIDENTLFEDLIKKYPNNFVNLVDSQCEMFKEKVHNVYCKNESDNEDSNVIIGEDIPNASDLKKSVASCYRKEGVSKLVEHLAKYKSGNAEAKVGSNQSNLRLNELNESLCPYLKCDDMDKSIKIINYELDSCKEADPRKDLYLAYTELCVSEDPKQALELEKSVPCSSSEFRILAEFYREIQIDKDKAQIASKENKSYESMYLNQAKGHIQEKVSPFVAQMLGQEVFKSDVFKDTGIVVSKAKELAPKKEFSKVEVHVIEKNYAVPAITNDSLLDTKKDEVKTIAQLDFVKEDIYKRDARKIIDKHIETKKDGDKQLSSQDMDELRRKFFEDLKADFTESKTDSRNRDVPVEKVAKKVRNKSKAFYNAAFEKLEQSGQNLEDIMNKVNSKIAEIDTNPISGFGVGGLDRNKVAAAELQGMRDALAARNANANSEKDENSKSPDAQALSTPDSGNIALAAGGAKADGVQNEDEATGNKSEGNSKGSSKGSEEGPLDEQLVKKISEANAEVIELEIPVEGEASPVTIKLVKYKNNEGPEGEYKVENYKSFESDLWKKIQPILLSSPKVNSKLKYFFQTMAKRITINS